MEWLKQLTAVLDLLNLELGIMHQDFSPRNLLIDPETQQLRLFDFDRAARIGHVGCDSNRNDVTGVIFTLYESVTGDLNFRQVPSYQQDAHLVQKLEEWPVKNELDKDISFFREHLNEWTERLRELQDNITDEDSKRFIDVPDLPRPSLCLVGRGETTGEDIYKDDDTRSRTDALKLGLPVINWERPSQKCAHS